MPEITSPRQLFTYKLSTVLASEREILKTLKQLRKEANDPELAQLFEHHAQETEQHVANVEQAFEALGEQPQEPKPRVVERLVLEHDDFKKQSPSPEVLDAFLIGAATATEHHEIAAYQTLITMASTMGQEDVVTLLEENLEQEQHTLQEVERTATRFAQQVIQPTT